MATRIDPFSSQHLEAACRVLADTERGLSGTQIERLLLEIEVADTSPGMTKWKRLFNALAGAPVTPARTDGPAAQAAGLQRASAAAGRRRAAWPQASLPHRLVALAAVVILLAMAKSTVQPA